MFDCGCLWIRFTSSTLYVCSGVRGGLFDVLSKKPSSPVRFRTPTFPFLSVRVRVPFYVRVFLDSSKSRKWSLTSGPSYVWTSVSQFTFLILFTRQNKTKQTNRGPKVSLETVLCHLVLDSLSPKSLVFVIPYVRDVLSHLYSDLSVKIGSCCCCFFRVVLFLLLD